MITAMCGFIGAFNLNDKPAVPMAEVRAGLSALQRRGPDDEGFFECPGLALGHCRLAIIDLAGGRQPMTDSATGVTLVFNGEIFNFRELRAQLEKTGHVFSTVSDTEVLLRAYLEWGRECPARLRGMFAFAVYDPRNQTLFLARDRMGVKPLFYAETGAALFFASAVPALLCFSAVERTMDLAAVSHYLTSIRTTLGCRTLFAQIKSLLPGETLLAKRGVSQTTVRRYWDYPIVAAADKPAPGVSAAAKYVAETMEAAVREQLVSDVPLGGFLSGGLDSSIIAGLAHKFGEFDAYSVGYDLPGYNEWSFVRQAADYYKMRCHEIHLTMDDYADDWRFLVAQKGLPVSTPNEIPIYRLAQALRQDFTVALSGEGADEIFGGYVRAYFSAWDYERARHAPPRADERLTPLDQAMLRLYRRTYFLCLADHFFLHCSWIPFREKRALLQPEIWRALAEDSEIFAYYDDWFGKLAPCSNFDAYMHLHARINLEGLLFRVDASTMAASVEARVPFTDHRLAEYLFTLPDDYKIRWRDPALIGQAAALNVEEIDKAGMLESKVLLRCAFQENVPREILERPKMSFPTPVFSALPDSLHAAAADALQTSALNGGFFRPEALARLMKTSAHQPSAMALWAAANLCLWQIATGAKLP